MVRDGSDHTRLGFVLKLNGMSYTYDSQFMDYTTQSSRYSARTIVRVLSNLLQPKSVLDVGCARGTWLDEWRLADVAQIFGVDGDYVEPKQLLIPADCFLAADLSQPIVLNRRFDLVQSLEVAEHIPASAADTFINNLVNHASGAILFSAAPPGQGGEFHVNEQPYDYWRNKFRAHDFEAYDFIRPLIANDKSVSFWYRFNTLLYVRANAAAALLEQVRHTKVADRQPIDDVSPLAFRARKMLVRKLPSPVRQALARVKARMLSTMGK